MANEQVSRERYEFDHQQQSDLAQKVGGLMRECLRTSNTRLSFPVSSPNDLRDGRFVFFLFLKDKDGRKERVAEEMKMLMAARGDYVRDQLKSEFPELRRVEFKINNDGSGLAVVCTVDEVVDSAPEALDEEVERLAAGFSAADLNRRSGVADLALTTKGQRFFDGLGIDGIEIGSVVVRDQHVVCVVRCAPLGERIALDARMRRLGVEHRATNFGGYVEMTCQVSLEIFDSGVWPEVAGVAGGSGIES